MKILTYKPIASWCISKHTTIEAEVVAMTAAMLGSKTKSYGGHVCGNITPGGTESILMAVTSTWDFMKATCGITAPEMWDPRLIILMDCYLNMWLEWDFWQRQFQWIHILWESTVSSESSYDRATRTVWATARPHMCWCGEWWEQPAKRHLHEQTSGLKR